MMIDWWYKVEDYFEGHYWPFLVIGALFFLVVHVLLGIELPDGGPR